MSTKKVLGRVGVVLSVAVMVVVCTRGKERVTTTKDTAVPKDTPYNYDPVKIGDLTWTKQNINIKTPNSWCYGDNESNCAKYGRLYTWEAAKQACQSLGGKWRLPTNDDWEKLVDYAGGIPTAGKKLKSKSGWDNDGNGTDDYGFSAMPSGGRYDSDVGFHRAGYYGYWWSATEYIAGNAFNRNMRYNRDDVGEGTDYKNYGFSVRCVAQD